MGILDLGYLAIFIAIVAAVAFGLAWALSRWAGHMSRKRILLASSLPIPALLMGLSIYSVIMVSTMTAEECGVDACGFAMVGATMLLGMATLAMFLGWKVAAFSYRIAHRPK